MSDASAIRVENHRITARDKTLLSANLYRPQDHNNHTVLIAGAMGMPQRFYRHYARFLAEQGCVVLTFDYRGIADSKQNGTLWGYEAHLWQWAALDLQAMIKWLTRQYPGAELGLIGHSLGGHLLGAASNSTQVSALMGVSSQSTYWKNWSYPQRIVAGFFWFIVLPLITHAMGYFPSKWFQMGEALPKHIALDWTRGAGSKTGNKGLFTGTEHDHYTDFTGYTRFYSFSDDEMMAPKKSVDAILEYYPNAKKQQRRHVTPESIGMDEIRHHRFFRPEMRDTLWQESFQWLMNPAEQVETVVGTDSKSLQSVPQAG